MEIFINHRTIIYVVKDVLNVVLKKYTIHRDLLQKNLLLKQKKYTVINMIIIKVCMLIIKHQYQ